MILTFYLQYFDYNDNGFDVSNDYYKTENDYVKQLEDSYNQTKDVIYEMMSQGNELMSKGTYKFMANQTNVKNEKISYAKCQGVLFNLENNEETENTIIEYSLSQELVADFMQIDKETMDEEFETNWHQYVDSTNKIMNYGTNDEWKFLNKPKKDIYFSFENKMGKIIYGKMENCRIEESVDFSNNLIFAEKINIIDKLP